jgi:hypothetical protein
VLLPVLLLLVLLPVLLLLPVLDRCNQAVLH